MASLSSHNDANATITVQQHAFEGEHHLGGPQSSPQTTEAIIVTGGVRPVEVQVQVQQPAAVAADQNLGGPQSSPQTTEAIIVAGGSFQNDHIAVDVGALMSEGPDQNTGPILSFETSLPEGPDQNPGSPEDGLGPTRSSWIRWSVPLDAFNFVSNAMAGVFVNNFPGDLTDVVHLIFNRSNGIRQLVFLAGCNFFSNALVGLNYLRGEIQEAHGTNWRAELIASVGAPIAVAVFTLLSSFRFASDREGWSTWIEELSKVNAAMIGGGPLAFYGMRNLGTEN